MKRKVLVWRRAVPLAAVLLLVVACGAPPPVSLDLLVEENAWTLPVPDEAEIVSPEEFARRVAAGETRLITSEMLAEQAAEREATFDADRAALESMANPAPAVAALLADAAGVEAYEGERAVELPNGGTVSLFGFGTQFRHLVETEALAQDPANALADYALSHALAPTDIQAQLPTPESLEGAPLADVRGALAQLEALLATSADPSVLGTARLEPAGAVGPAQVGSGNGTDNDGACEPTHLAGQYWYPLRSFISPMKDQGQRATCWAFTAIGALESRERVQNDSAVDLSEQFLVNKVKQDWAASDFSDEYASEPALNTAWLLGQRFPSEGYWTYNPAPNRANGTNVGAARYVGSCTGYSGSCSPTAHQSLQVCVPFTGRWFCSYAGVQHSGSGPAPSQAIQVWSSGEPFELSRYRRMLAQGHVLMASFPVYKGFSHDVAADGIVSNYAATHINLAGNEVPGSAGNHVVQIVGFLSNQDMTRAGVTPNIGGGGYFIVKNSWGCSVGDSGFYYVPADYVSRHFISLSVLAFDGRRSSRWVSEQATPGTTIAPSITIRANPGFVDLRSATNLAPFFTIAHPVARSVTLKVTSDRDGVLYDGPWATDPNGFGPELTRTFATTGVRTLTLEASYGSGRRSANLNVTVQNTAPTVNLAYAGTAYVGVAYPLTALISDVNEGSGSALCSRTTWSVDAPDGLAVATGCNQQVTFGAMGAREVRVRTVDTEGAVGVRNVSLNVQPAPANPYPQVVSYGVYARDDLVVGGTYLGCDDFAVASGATVDLREDGCTFPVISDPPKRFSAAVVVENPDAEPLTYDWRTIVTFNGVDTTINTLVGSASGTYVPSAPGNTVEVTNDCRVTVTVNAPDPTRSKSLTVWAGRCTYWSTRIN